MKRRLFLKGLAGLAALSVAGQGLAVTQLAIDTEYERLKQMLIKSGYIHDQVFYFDDGIVIDWQETDVIITRCSFYFKTVTKPSMIHMKSTKFHVDQCEFKCLQATKPKIEQYMLIDNMNHSSVQHSCFDGCDAHYGFRVITSNHQATPDGQRCHPVSMRI